MKQPRVKDIIKTYKEENIIGVKKYLNNENFQIDSSSWAGYIKQLIDAKEYITAKAAIELIAYKFIKL